MENILFLLHLKKFYDTLALRNQVTKKHPRGGNLAKSDKAIKVTMGISVSTVVSSSLLFLLLTIFGNFGRQYDIIEKIF